MYLSPKRIAGFSVLETVMAAAIFIMAIVGIYGVYSVSVRAMVAADHSAISSENLLQRIEQLRATSWANATSPSYISNLLAGPLSATSQNLRNIVEEHITVSVVSVPLASPTPSPLPTATATPSPFTVSRRGTTVTVSPSTATAMDAQTMVKVLVSLTWLDNTNQQHTREYSTYISKAGMTH